jgi:CRP/FNR family transcriptional regulator
VLANLLGLARETLSRQLSRFSEAGLVELRGKDIVILDVPALQATAAEGDR